MLQHAFIMAYILFLLGGILAFIGRTWLNCHTSHSDRMHYVGCKFGGVWSIMKGTLLEVRSTYFTCSTKYLLGGISAFIGGTRLKCRTSHFDSMRYVGCTFGGIWSIMKGTLLEVRSTYFTCSM
jgi:hypothetical protein